MSDGITVIIPCYNTAKYLNKCINSILDQTYKQLEIILIDDKSTDTTKKLITKYTKDYKNIKAIYNSKNSGAAGYSRNQALSIASYDYISFIDSDDYIESNFYESLMKVMKKEKADVAICDIFLRYENTNDSDIRSIAKNNGSDNINYIDHGLAASPCNKLFRKADLLKYPFPENIMNEDIATVFPIMINSRKIAYTNQTYYNYVQREKSVQNDNLSERRFDIFKILDILSERIGCFNEQDKYWEAIIFNQVIMFFFYVLPKEPNFFKRQRFLKKFSKLTCKYKIRQNHLYWTFIRNQGKYHKIYYKTLLKLNCNGLSFATSLLMSLFRIYQLRLNRSVIKKTITIDDIVYLAKKTQKKSSKLKLSVIVPNYNYEKFLLERIYSILNQKKYRIYELIILDDMSMDDSRDLIEEIEKEISPYINFKKKYNIQNSGSAFKQWRKAFEIATGDYIWIAEADDYCKSNLLKKVLKPMISDKRILLSYCDTAFIDKVGYIILKTIKKEIDITNSGHWDKNYRNDGMDEIKSYSYLNCTIANVSSVIFKKGDYEKFFDLSDKYKQAGDWLFYLNVISLGKIAYYNKPLNYYRVHGNNATSINKYKLHFDEIKKVHDYIEKHFGLNKKQKKMIINRYKFLQKAWHLNE